MRIDHAKLLLRLTAGLAVVILTCGFQYAYTTNATTGLPLRWAPGTIPILIMADNTTVLSDGHTRATSIQAAMQETFRGWNQYLGDVQFAPQILPAGSGADGDNLNQIFFASSPYNQNWESNTLAVTTAWYHGNTRVESDIILNSASTWDSYRGPAKSGAVDLERVTMHELGHLLGLEHPDAAGLTVQSVMNSSAVDYESLQVYDVLAAQFLYGAPGIPPNDSFASATGIRIPIGNAAITVSGYNTNATKEISEPNHANNAGGHSVWWKWVAPSSGPVSLTTAGSAFDTVLGVYTGSDVTALTAIASNDNVQDGTNLTSAVTFSGAAGTTYYFAVDGNNNGNATDSGGIALNLTFTPAATIKSQTASSGHSVTFSINVPAGSTVQWQVSADESATWSNVAADTFYSGVTTPNLTISSASSGMSGLRYRAVVTTADGVSSTSDYGVLNVVVSVFSFPSSITIDGAGNLYVGDTSLDTVQKITSTTAVSPLAGSASSAGTTDGAGAAARFNQPGGLAANSAGVVGVSDTANAIIRVIQTDGTVSTLAGSSANHGSVDATGTAASFSSPIGIARDSSGTFYVADGMNHVIRKVTSAGVVTTLAGRAGVAGAADGIGSAASFNYPTGIAVDSSGNAYVADTTNNLIRKITPSGTVTTIAGVAGVAGSTDGTGSAALFNTPGGLAVDSAGTVYLADTGNSTIRRITPDGVVVTLAGLPGIAGFKDGNNSDAWFNQPKAVTVDIDGTIYVADTGNAAIRKVTPAGVVTTLVLTAAINGTTTSSTTSTIPPTTAATTASGGGGAPSTWFFGALGLLAWLRRKFHRDH